MALQLDRSRQVWAALNRSPGQTLATLIILYLAVASYQASTRLLWDDELITAAVAAQGSAAGIWHALVAGSDPNPPLTYWAVLISTRLLGQSAFALRIPSIVFMLGAILAVWSILRRWLEPGFAAIGVLTFMATRGFDYCYEARSYAALTAFTMAALRLWLNTVPQERPGSTDTAAPRYWPSLALMTLCLAGAVSSNYWGILAWFPIAAGEAVVWLRSRRIRLELGLALLLATAPVLAYMPLVRHNLAEFAPHAWNRASIDILPSSYLILVEGVFWPVLSMAVLGWRWRVAMAGGTSAHDQRRPPIGAPEQAALGTLLLYPALGLVVAYAGAAIISSRCVLPVCCGFAIAAAILASRLFSNRPRTALILLVVSVGWVLARESVCAVLLARQRVAYLAIQERVTRLAAGGPILISDFALALPLSHYAVPRVRDQLIFPIDFEAIHATEEYDSGEQNLWAGRNGVFPIGIVRFGCTLPVASALVIGRPGNWLTKDLAQIGVSLSDQTSSADTRHLQAAAGVFTPVAQENAHFFRSTVAARDRSGRDGVVCP